MTPDQLDEIEKLAEAGGVVPRTAADNAYAKALREYALPLVKAVREARAALDEREGDMHARIRAGYDKTVADMWRAHCARIEKERDAALAEMDEFAIAVGYGERPEGQSGVHRLHGQQLADRWKNIERERDEAQAEVERLREAARQVHARLDRVTIDWDSGLNRLLCDIHKITKGMVE